MRMVHPGNLENRHHSPFLVPLIILVFFSGVAAAAPYGPATCTMLSVLTGDTHQYYPDIYRDLVIWIDNPGSGHAHLYNLTSGEEKVLFSSFIPVDGMCPDLSGRYATWTTFDGSGYGVILYDMQTGEESWIAGGNGSMAWNSRISGDSVVWEENVLGGFDIYRMDIRTGEVTLLTPGTEGSDQTHPAISGEWVAWQSLDPASGTSDIYLTSLLTGNVTLVTAGTEDSDEQYPAIDGDHLVFQRLDPSTYCSDIYLYTCSSGETELLTPDTESTSEEYPSVHQGRVIWIGQDPGDSSYQLFLHEIWSGLTYQLPRAMDQDPPGLPQIFANRIVWQQPDPLTGYSDIFLITLGVDDPPLIAGLSAEPLQGGVPLQVNFTGISPGEPSGWYWDFGDGTTSAEQNPSHIYTVPGIYGVSLIVHNLYQRSGVYTPSCIYAKTPPIPAFSFDRGEGLAPLTVQFNDLSTGSPETYLWDFGDGSTSDEKDPSHTYPAPGIFRVSLTTGNDFGNSTTSVDGCIVVTPGIRNDLLLDIPGVTCQGGMPCELTLNSSKVEINVINNTSIDVVPDPGTGIGKIRFIAEEGFSWIDQFSIKGNLSRVDISSIPLFYGDDNSTLTYLVSLEDYPANGTVHTEVWTNATPQDYQAFKDISIFYGYSGIRGVAFTARFETNDFSSCPKGVLVFGVDPEWVERNGWRNLFTIDTNPDKARVYLDSEFLGYSPVVLDSSVNDGDHLLRIEYPGYMPNETIIHLGDKKDSIHVVRIPDNGTCEVLPATFLYHDNTSNLDYFLAESPHGFSTFGVVSASRAGSPMQIFYLTLSKIISGGTSTTTALSGGGGGGGGGYGGSGSLGSAAPAPTPVSTMHATIEEFPPVAPTRVFGPTREETPAPTVSPPMTPQGKPLPENPAPVIPSAIGFALVRNVAVVFGIVLVAAILVLRWKGGGSSP